MTAHDQQMAKVRDLSVKIVAEQATTLARRGIPAEQFKGMLSEAIVTVPEIIKCTDQASLARAIRNCCRDGLLPDGVEAVITPRKGGAASYLPMVTGLKKLLYKATNGDIKSGVIWDGDSYEVVEAAGADPVIRVTPNLMGGKRDFDSIVAVWAWFKMPNQTAVLMVMNKEDILKARGASAMPGGAWKAWPGPMAEKSVVKRLMNRLRYLIPGGAAAISAMDGDDEYVVDSTAEPVEVEMPEEPEPKEEAKASVDEADAEADADDLWEE